MEDALYGPQRRSGPHRPGSRGCAVESDFWPTALLLARNAISSVRAATGICQGASGMTWCASRSPRLISFRTA